MLTKDEELNAVADAILERIEAEGFNREAFLRAVRKYEASNRTDSRAEERITLEHPVNYMTEYEAEHGDILNRVLDRIYATEGE